MDRGGTVSGDTVMNQEFGFMFRYKVGEDLSGILNVDLKVVRQPLGRDQFVFVEHEMFQLIQHGLVGRHLGFRR